MFQEKISKLSFIIHQLTGCTSVFCGVDYKALEIFYTYVKVIFKSLMMLPSVSLMAWLQHSISISPYVWRKCMYGL